MAEEYIEELRKQLKGFSTKEQEALIEEISSHIEDGEEDPRMGKDVVQRRKKLMNELGSAKDMANGLKETYRPNRFIDYLFILIPYLLYPYLNSLYMSLIPKYGWADVRLDVVVHLPLVALALWRRSAPLALFWITVLISQLLYITTQLYEYYGTQTLFWVILLLALLALAGYLIWKNRNDPLIVVFGLLPLSMCLLGGLVSVIRPTGATPYGFLNLSLMVGYLSIRDFSFYLILGTMALFFLSANRGVRWLALVISGLLIGLGRDYLIEFQTSYSMTPMAQWVYYMWIILPLLIVFLGWWLERSTKQQLRLTTS